MADYTIVVCVWGNARSKTRATVLLQGPPVRRAVVSCAIHYREQYHLLVGGSRLGVMTAIPQSRQAVVIALCRGIALLRPTY